MIFLALLLATTTGLASRTPTAAPGTKPDVVRLAQGDKLLAGRVVFEGKDEIVLRVDGKDKRIPRADVADIQSLERSLAPIIDRDLRSSDAATLAPIAAECEKAGLDAEAKNLWLRILLVDPADEAAVQGAGARKSGKDLKIPLGKEQRNLDDLTKRQASFKGAYDVATTHFLLESDLDLASALDLAVALERFYKRFYDTLGSPLELFVFDEKETPEVFVYGHGADFPVAPVPGDVVWFAPGINRLNVLAEAKPSIGSMVAELSKMMLFNSLRRSSGATAQVPMWTAEGIAQIFGRAAPSVPFGPWADLAQADGVAFALADRASLSLERVFNATANDFNADAKRDEMQASAYTLVHFLVFGEGGALRPGYGAFLREGAKGKISIRALGESLKLPPKEIESGWRAHVKANAK